MIASGSTTASIAPDTGLLVNTFSTFLFPVSASAFTGSGEGLWNIPLNALAKEASRIASGSVSASVAPDTGFTVVSSDFGSQFSGSVDISGSLFLSDVSSSLYTSGSVYINAQSGALYIVY